MIIGIANGLRVKLVGSGCLAVILPVF